jgi:lysine-N-methylase
MDILHRTEYLQTLTPKYVTQFECTGAACRDTCCNGWAINIDRKSYIAYKSVRAPILGSLFRLKLQRTRAEQSEKKYAVIKLDTGSSNCPFLSESLCTIQQEMGQDKLSHTCYNYPRSTTEIAGIRQQALNLSCPQAAMLALSDGAMDFGITHLQLRPDLVLRHTNRINLGPNEINSIRFALVKIILDRSVPLWIRLAGIGASSELIDHHARLGKSENLIANLAYIEDSTRKGKLSADFVKLEMDPFLQSVVIFGIWNLRRGSSTSDIQRIVQDEVAAGLGVDLMAEVNSAQLIIDGYINGLELLLKLTKEAPHLFENFLANEMFREVFPFRTESPLQHFKILLLKFSVIRLMLAARCNTRKRSLTFEEAVETISVFSRLYGHWEDFQQNAEKILAIANITSPTASYNLIKH